MGFPKAFILFGLICYVQSAAVSDDTVELETLDASKYERLLDRFWQQSTVARRNTPPFDEAGLVDVKYGLSLIDVREVNADTGVVELLVWEQMDSFANWSRQFKTCLQKELWIDNRMIWQAEEYGGIEDIRVPNTMIWKPDLMTYNSFMTEDIETRTEVNAVVSSDGEVKYIPPSYKKIRCNMDDNVASCRLKVGSWTFNGAQVDIHFYNDQEKMDVSNFHTSSLVPRIENNEAVRNEVIYECCPEAYIDLTFNFDLVIGGQVAEVEEVEVAESVEVEDDGADDADAEEQ